MQAEGMKREAPNLQHIRNRTGTGTINGFNNGLGNELGSGLANPGRMMRG